MLVATGDDGSHCVMHVYSHGLVTIDIQYDLTSDDAKKRLSYIAFSKNKGIESEIQTLLGKKCLYTRSVPSAIKRGKICPYFQLGDDRLWEIHQTTQLVTEVNSPWQNIKIYKTPDCGNMLCLDDEIMIAESDNIYTLTLLGINRNVYKDKTILILGGGDGGLLHELLKMLPQYVLMVEIDKEVINACRKHLRGVCGDTLDNLDGHNYKIRIENCVNVLKELAEENQKFDYVINDLSEYLLDTEKGHDNDFTTTAIILERSMKVLNVGGKYLSRGDSESNVPSIESFGRDVTENGLNFKTFKIDVPSFKEKYCLFEVWRA
ncbi:spermine synthase-like [Ruditapes philippinarum]|uniref:spermine synthase-like n=1 Tax=Ruditapes philippinarum TaxID=129788 RepID=UPI00295B50EB|nr:spermine synthase-like [Ruditapes philippinarum]